MGSASAWSNGLFVCLESILSNLPKGVTKRRTVSMNPTRTTASSCSWRWVKPNILLTLRTRTTQYFHNPPWKPGQPKISWKPGQLQQEDCALQLWQSEEPQHPGQHQRLDVRHWLHQNQRGRPRLHPEVSSCSWMVLMRHESQDNKTLHERYDYRIKYLNLKKTRSQNSLALEDVQRLWIPFLVFDNTERNEATKVSQWTPYGLFSPGQGKWAKCVCVVFFEALLWPNGFLNCSEEIMSVRV